MLSALRLQAALTGLILFSSVGSVLAEAPLYFQGNPAAMSGVFIVDVRNPRDFDLSHIPDAYNVPLFALKSKTFLKTKPVVLVGQGFPSSALERECRSLRAQGWNVSLLEGGMRDWRGRCFPLEGASLDHRELAFVTPADYLAERDAYPWLLIDIGADGAGREFGARPVPWRAGGKEFLSRLGAELDRREGGSSGTVLIADGMGGHAAAARLVDGAFPDRPVFYLEGGWRALAEAVKKGQALLKPGTGRTSGGAAGGGAAAGCASCP
jgi:rhodanese-related sulfurtransferase